MKATGSRLPGGALLRAALALALLFFSEARATNGGEILNYYGLVTLADKAVGARLAARFKATGQPVFLVHDLNTGLGQNDIMRFADKAVLVDGAVWSTLEAEGALEKLSASPIVRVQAQTREDSWERRSNLVGEQRQKKAFKLGAELLRALEENFGGIPENNQITFEFSEGHLTLLAPDALLDQLRFSSVRKSMPEGRPTLVSPPPDSEQFVNQPFTFQAWGVDPSSPSAALTYALRGTPPPGLAWNPKDHALRGTPTAPGSWTLTAEVRNPQGGRDTLQFSLRFRVNQAPFISGIPKSEAVVGQEWRFRIAPSDPDHPGYLLKVRPGELPHGMRFNADSLFLSWKPDSSLAGTRHAFSLSVRDPLGASSEFHATIQVLARQASPLNEDIKVDLPWDTLIRGRTYVLKMGNFTRAWAGQGIQLQKIEGTDSTSFSGDSLRIRAMKAGIYKLEFHFLAQGTALSQRDSVPVRENLPPGFVTELSDWRLFQGDPPHAYRPAALDPEGEPVALTVQIPRTSPLRWDGKRLLFSPDTTGVYPARFTAKDPEGNTAEQWVAYQSKPQEAGMHWIVENRIMGEFTTWSVAADFGTGRIGLYSPDFTYGLVPYSYWLYKEPPFLFVGGNLMGREAEKKGQKLWVDAGVTFRYPAPRVVTGGLYGRIDGEWHFQNSPISWVEMEITAQAHQILAATDTGGLWFLLSDSSELRNLREHHPQGKGPLGQIFEDAYQGDNIVAFTRVEAFGSVGNNFYLGPSLWREDYFISQQYTQRFGAALRYRYPTNSDLYQATFRLGWGPNGDGWGAYATMRIALGVLQH